MEVRNITPNYANNTTSFGMAFKRPTPKQMEDFTEYVTKKGKTSSRLVKKGVEKIVNRHANDTHFDFVYIDGSNFEIIPKSAKARKMMEAGELPEDLFLRRGIIGRTHDKYFSDAYKEKLGKAQGIEAFCLLAKRAAGVLKARLALEFKPVDVLPKSMRQVSAQVDAYEKAVEKQINKEIKEAAAAKKAAEKSAKAAEKARIAAQKKVMAEAAAKQKAIDTVASAFDTKKR